MKLTGLKTASAAFQNRYQRVTSNRFGGLALETFKEFSKDECPRYAASLAYYTLFSLPALLIIVIAIAGSIFGHEAAQGRLVGEISGAMGQTAGEQIQEMVRLAGEKSGGGLIPKLVGAAVLVFGAMGAFLQLQAALNHAWDVAPDPKQGGIRNFISKRILSFGMLLALGFLLLVSLAVSAALSALGSLMPGADGEGFVAALLQGVETLVAILAVGLLFAAIFKLMPDAKVKWRDVWIGAGFTSLLFAAGKLAIGLYLGRSHVASAYGAAGSLAVVLVWLYYTSNIVLFGAEFTQVYARRHGRAVVPESGATKTMDVKIKAPPGVEATNGPVVVEARNGYVTPAEIVAATEAADRAQGAEAQAADAEERGSSEELEDAILRRLKSLKRRR